MKKIIAAVAIVLALALVSCGVGNITEETGSETETEFEMIEERPVEFYDADITVDGAVKTATYRGDVVEYSWSTEEWTYGSYKDMPAPEKNGGGIGYRFVVLEADDGVCDDLMNYAAQAVKSYLEDCGIKCVNTMMANETDDYFTSRGYFGVRTGYSDLSDQFNAYECAVRNFMIVYSVSDGKSSAVICLHLQGSMDTLTELYDSVFKDGKYYRSIELTMRDILSTFYFSKTKDEALDSLGEPRYIDYAYAREMFPIRDDEGYAQYRNRLYDEAMKKKAEAEALHEEILQLYDELYDSYYNPEINKDFFLKIDRETFFADYVTPFVEYYESMMKTAELGEAAMHRIFQALTCGGTGAAESSGWADIAIYYNVYAELAEIRNHLGGRKLLIMN